MTADFNLLSSYSTDTQLAPALLRSSPESKMLELGPKLHSGAPADLDPSSLYSTDSQPAPALVISSLASKLRDWCPKHPILGPARRRTYTSERRRTPYMHASWDLERIREGGRYVCSRVAMGMDPLLEIYSFEGEGIGDDGERDEVVVGCEGAARGVSEPLSSIPTPAPAFTKHALLELLTSERAYANDLALLRDVYMRLAPGYPPSFGFSCTKRPVLGLEISNPGSNASSSSSESTKSSSGTCSSLSSRTVSTVSTSNISVSGLCPPAIQLNVPSIQLNVPTFTQIGLSMTSFPPPDSKAPTQLSRPMCEPPLSVADTRRTMSNRHFS
ncbi:uncharacterized protein BJ212DRAFT_1486192 [Suillus subaureus]|uniref:DH domain-containing protein n=1 Tax=Suillus subaureus TaxID=48587 RepID=A0A9P7DXM8_9AGAM|nr:uncharacterized protein BJ212DRAFT_1486192 [Suillus subaureus]KAG1805852.1 hypothetical protein BJ212DRAFT_1486192 [Suillus subaureus]